MGRSCQLFRPLLLERVKVQFLFSRQVASNCLTVSGMFHLKGEILGCELARGKEFTFDHSDDWPNPNQNEICLVFVEDCDPEPYGI
ncbi:hypothetical protein MRB53_009789 [Persea americana]|uniref:Uncharacterized protein n=1 Tax=Persea americana TaxID=3435 RepID=A0ACC2LR13_PERAE|nr:hypothetical protein MRB53_009789 [Persea americana]